MLREVRSCLGKPDSLLFLGFGEGERTGSGVRGHFERPLVSKLLGCKVVGNIAMKSTCMGSGKEHQKCLRKILKLLLCARGLGRGGSRVRLPPHPSTCGEVSGKLIHHISDEGGQSVFKVGVLITALTQEANGVGRLAGVACLGRRVDRVNITGN